MAPDIYERLIEKLTHRTEYGTALWEATSKPDTFKIEMQSGGITLGALYDANIKQNVITLRVYNDSGEMIDQIDYGELSDYHQYAIGFDLYSLARSNYLKVDETIKSFLEELDSAEVIGRKLSTKQDATISGVFYTMTVLSLGGSSINRMLLENVVSTYMSKQRINGSFDIIPYSDLSKVKLRLTDYSKYLSSNHFTSHLRDNGFIVEDLQIK